MNDFGQTTDRPLPRLGMLREITDRSVLDEVFCRRRVTRGELASATGISKPTIWESVRRLESARLLRATGSRETGRRGRAATLYELAETAGWVLALAVDQQGIRVLAADMAGCPFGEDRQPPGAAGDTGALVKSIRRSVRRALSGGMGRGALQAVALSVANPVHPDTREIIALPSSPFPEGMLLPAELLADLTKAPLLVDNDVNLAAMAERRTGAAREASSFAYMYIGAGLGLGLYIGDQLIRGAHGLAGEIGYMSFSGNGEYITFSEALTRQGFGRSDAPSINVTAVLGSLGRAAAGNPTAVAAIHELGSRIGQAIVTTCAIVDPDLVLLGGPIGSQPALLEPARATVARLSPKSVRIEAGSVGESASLQGALHLALDHGRKQLLTSKTGIPQGGQG